MANCGRKIRDSAIVTWAGYRPIENCYRCFQWYIIESMLIESDPLHVWF